MADLIFRISPDIICGSHTYSRLNTFLKETGERFLLIIDPNLKKLNFYEKIIQTLDDDQIKYILFDKFDEGAASKQIAEAISIAKEAYIQGVISIGSSRAINFAKAVCSLINENFSIYDCIDGSPLKSKPLPLTAIPTTFREPYIFSNLIPITDSRSSRIKIINASPKITKLVIWDSEFSKTLDERKKNLMIFELFSQCFETYISPKSSFFSDMFAEKAFELLARILNPTAFSESTLSILREELLTQAGIMISTGTSMSSLGITNLLSLAIHSRYRIPSSESAAVIFPKIMNDSFQFAEEKICKIAKIMKISKEKSKNSLILKEFSNFINSFIKQNEFPDSLSNLNLSTEKLALVAEDASQTELMASLPKSMTSDTLFEILKASL